MMNVAVLGSVDSGKSTLVAVLTRGILDDGNGSARVDVMNHAHEKRTGRTSDIGYERLIAMGNTPIIHLLDLAGHEMYLRTTLRGLTNYHPAYALVVVNLNRGITRITKEHLLICRYLDIPVILVLTKIDLCDPTVPFTELPQFKEVKALLKLAEIKFSYPVTDETSLNEVRDKFLSNPRLVCPYFMVSNKTGLRIDLLRKLLTQLPPQPAFAAVKKFATSQDIGKVFFIYRPYFIKGIGWIIHGYCGVGSISRNDHIVVGPIGTTRRTCVSNDMLSLNGEFMEVRVRSIHNELREEIETLTEGMSGCLAIRSVDARLNLTAARLSSGKIALSRPYAVRQIKAEIFVSSARVTVSTGTSLYLHSSNVSTISYIVKSEKEPLRYRDTSHVIIHLPIPQFIFPGSRIILRDGGVRVVGLVRDVYVNEVVPVMKPE